MRNGAWFFLPALALLGLAVLMQQGCATVDYTAGRVASAVDRYCMTTSEMERAAIRAQIDAQTEHRVRVECAK